ncbi:Bug family tripartite tricarboxylate transporter substrate binding protein [Azohydromonas australica]|uniref:Bug family tripartite tricarboxylate transporter substrate binding protein n=1 Tax=Azohydromonas australica TaxID=364039 RepID=UPI0003FAC2D9|nr:tripartite tricarboxylate transporter substrate-binding protein [Azohydromonas australica]
MKRRSVLKWSAVALAGGAVPLVRAQSPHIRLVVPFPPGAANDTIARLLADAIAKRSRRTWIVENKAGAGSMIGIDSVAKAAADGTTLLFGASDGLAVLPAVRPVMPYDPGRDFAHLARIATSPYVLVVNSQVSARDFAGFVKLANQQPGNMRVATTGTGTLGDMGTILLASAANVELTSVPYKGMSPAVNDLVAGHVEALLVTPTTIAPHLASGKVRALVVLGPRRSPMLPDVPTAAEVGLAGADVAAWWGVLAPAKTPAGALAALRSEIAAVLGDAEFRKAIAEKGFDVAPLDGDAFAKFAAADFQRWRDVARKAGITLKD